jgi:uncharacterized OB-fold protein
VEIEEEKFGITENEDDVMEYCPKCGTILVPKYSGIACTECTYFECF